MIRSQARFVRPLASLFVFGLLVAAAPRAGAQVTLDDRVASLAEHVKKKDDDSACRVIEGLSQAFGGLTEEDKKKAISALEKCLNAKRDEADDKLFEAVVNSFANMGELGEKATIKNLKTSSVDKRRGVLAAALRSLGLHKNVADVKVLTDYLVHNEPMVVAGAAEALGQFGDQPEKVRKPIVEELVKNYAQYSSAASNTSATNAQKATAKDRLNTVEKPFQVALQTLTGQEFKDAPSAQKWFNDNKTKKWAEPAAAGG